MRQRRTFAIVMGLLFTLLLFETASAFYSPSTGRFLNRDPINEPGAVLLRTGAQPKTTFIPRDPMPSNDDLNEYCFVRNSPLNHIDALGLRCEISLERGSCFGWVIRGCHYTLVVETDEGTWNIDGGPSSSKGGCDKLDVYINGDRFDEMPSWDDEPFNQCACVLHAARKWKARKCYKAFCGPNSNSAIACILRACMVPTSKPDYAWGWNDLYDHGADNCTDPSDIPR